MTGDSGRAVWLEQACSYLRGADPVLARLIDARPDFDPRAWLARVPPMDLFGALLFQVIGQQLSVAATRRTLARIGALFDGHLPTPAGLLAVDPAKLREAGLSWRKIGTLRRPLLRLRSPVVRRGLTAMARRLAASPGWLNTPQVLLVIVGGPAPPWPGALLVDTPADPSP